MAFCEFCQKLNVYAGVCALQLDSADESYIDNWHNRLEDVDKSSKNCDLCALVMKGWREHRTVVVEERVHSGELDMDPPPDDLYNDILNIQNYRSSNVSVLVKEFTDIEGFGDNGLLKRHLFLRALLDVSGQMVTSGDHTNSLQAAFRITSDYGR